MEPSIGLVETNSIAKGIEAADAMLKEADVNLIDAYPICPGKYVILVNGILAQVKTAVDKGVDVAGDTVVNSFVIPNVHKSLIPAMLGTNEISDIESVGAVETFDIASCIVAADSAAKTAPVKMIEIRLAKGLGGKSYFTITGEVGDVKSAISKATETIKDQATVVRKIVIPFAHKELLRTLL